LGLTVLAGGCRDRTPGTDLLAAAAIRSGDVAGHDKTWIVGEIAKPIRVHDYVLRTLPATAPSRIEISVRVPKGGHLTVHCGIPDARHSQPGVEFVVKRRQGKDERVLATQLVDPLKHDAHQRWVPLDIDLGPAGGEQTLILETRGFEKGAEAYWGAPLVTAPGAKAPLVIIYLVDTLRADHTNPYGYERDTTPELVKFAADAVVFENGITAASWTKPAVGSLLTSQLPGQHGAVQLRDPLDPRQVTLAEMLRAKGYVTGASISNSVIYSAHTNFEKGFEYFAGLHNDKDRQSKEVKAGPVVDTALEWLALRTGLPTFLYVHTMDPHVPYTPPEPFKYKYAPTPEPEHPGTDPRYEYKEPADRDRLIAQYDGEIAYGDQEFGRFMRELKARGLYEDAMIVFLADHGEEFQDHGQWLHGRSVFDELVRVPLIVKFPGNRNAGTRIAQQVRTVDILPTVLQEMRLPVPQPPAIVGVPMQPVVAGKAPEPDAVSEISHRGYVAYGIRGGQQKRDKYIRRFSPEEDELYYDLRNDPQEKTNRFAAARDRTRELRSALEEQMAPSQYQHHLKLVGPGAWALDLRCGGFIDAMETVDFGSADRATLADGKHTLHVEIHGKAGQTRELTLSVRPMGAPIWVSGTRDGKPLAATDVYLAKEGVRPPQVPFKLPEVEPTANEHLQLQAGAEGAPPPPQTPQERRKSDLERLTMTEPPATTAPGLHIWVTARAGVKLMEMDEETRARLKALGYLGQ
jgi:arylsulfatase A-like enzyme